MGKISVKIGILFFITILFLETILIFYLHKNVIHTRVHEELTALKTRGNNHRDILEISYHDETIKHIALMESRTDTQVIVTDQNGSIIMSSNKISKDMKKLIANSPKNIPRGGEILEDDWKNQTYISSVSPIFKNNEHQGNVYMFKNTELIKELIDRLNRHFLLAGTLSLLFMVIIITLLSKLLTSRLIKMNEATKRISRGDFSVTLPNLGKDEIGELGESIRVLARDLEHLKKERNEFLASISHELRTPLTYIKGYAEIAKKQETVAADRDKYLGIIVEESTKLSTLIKELFDLAKMDENTFTIQKEEILLQPYLSNIIEKMKPAFEEMNMELRFSCPEHITASLDPTRFEQVIINLLDNARKYSDPNTKTELIVKEALQEIVITIKDAGKGIPEDDLPRIFNRFYRVDKSRSRSLGGTGLGLSIVKELVESHDGWIEVTSIENLGTTFIITLKK